MINKIFLNQASNFPSTDIRQKKTKMRKNVPISISLSQHSKSVFTSVSLQEKKICEPLKNSEDMQKKCRKNQNIKVRK